MARCEVCFRKCEISEGGTGFCGARINKGGKIEAKNYGKVSSLALDPIEKKPLKRFYPGSRILSVGSFGCNLRCPFCQNHEISWSRAAMLGGDAAEYLPPEQLAELARQYRGRGNIGVAFTYNEPLVGYEYVRDTARLVHERGMKNVLVTNGTASLPVLEELAPYIDAMNIDLKGFTDRYYTEVLKGSRQMVLDFIKAAVRECHVEVTCLVVPGENDSEEELLSLCRFLSGLTDGDGNRVGRKIPLHISRFFPRFHMTDREATDVELIYHLAQLARSELDHVYTGNC